MQRLDEDRRQERLENYRREKQLRKTLKRRPASNVEDLLAHMDLWNQVRRGTPASDAGTNSPYTY